MKYIEIYKQFAKARKLPDLGLCNSLIGFTSDGEKAFKRIIPTHQERVDLAEKGFDTTYWASGMKDVPFESRRSSKRRYSGFTPLRQTILLLCAAMNKEL